MHAVVQPCKLLQSTGLLAFEIKTGECSAGLGPAARTHVAAGKDSARVMMHGAPISVSEGIWSWSFCTNSFGVLEN
jgi:hypothetical protein